MQVSKNYNRGTKLTSIAQVQKAAASKQALWTKNWGIKPAKVLENQTVRNLQRMLDKDYIYRIVKINK